jgi:hypothetical protein
MGNTPCAERLMREHHWILTEPQPGITVAADSDAVWILGLSVDAAGRPVLRRGEGRSRLARLLPLVVQQMCEAGIAENEGGAIAIPHQVFCALEEQGIDAFDDLLPWAPFSLEIESTGWLGGRTFGYRYRYVFGNQIVAIERLGSFVRRADRLYRLDKRAYALLQAIDTFNAHPRTEGDRRPAFIEFANIKGLAREIGAQLDRYLEAEEHVIVPHSIALDLVIDSDNRVSFVPKIEGVDQDSLQATFLATEDVEDIFVVPQPDGRRVRVVLDDGQREALRRMQRIRHLGGVNRVEVLRQPYAVFDGVADKVEIDLSRFGPRVTGVGDFPFVVVPYVRIGTTGIFEGQDESNGSGTTPLAAGLSCKYADGTVDEVEFRSGTEIAKLRDEVAQAELSGHGCVEFRGKSIVVDAALLAALNEQLEIIGRPASPREKQPRKKRAPKHYVLILRNEESLEFNEGGADSELPEVRAELPNSLAHDVALKPHQVDGIAWLQTNFLGGRRGCLLADDMGLGKTLQVLTFLAWLIERGELESNGSGAGYRPFLIVTPLILLENETWVADMRRFFADDGAIFQPWCALHSGAITMFRRDGFSGTETILGESSLDLEKLSTFRVLLTNYETVVNYQHSFAQMKDRWTVVVTDEAQEHKTPSTKTSHALKSLSPRFKISCTGTPVETRLMDLWNIFDFLQPGSVLGSGNEFSRQYEKPLESAAIDDSVAEIVQPLKKTLRLGRPDAFLLRRDKSRLDGLPRKFDHELRCDLSPEQRDIHLNLVQQARRGVGRLHPFALISQLFRLYQHPGLVPSYEPIPPQAAISRCPKLAVVLGVLDEVKSYREKALVFTRSLDMQQMIVSALYYRFALDVDVVNGTTGRHGETKSASKTRKEIVRRFRESDGFNVLVLSPDVAGIGLTLVEANHVIHYGRWWNPAREAQATDRVYRIGQSRDVHVYYPIARDPQRGFETFDEKLHALIQHRRLVAQEFLAPMPVEDRLGEELLSSVLSESIPEEPKPKALSLADIASLSPDRFEALIALMEEKVGAHVILTPSAGDDGMDVISFRGSAEVRLIQCKHTRVNSVVGPEVIEEVKRAFDGYRFRRMRGGVAGRVLRPILITNGSCTRGARTEARANDIDILEGAEMLRMLNETRCSTAAIEIMASKRARSMPEVDREIARALGLPGAERMLWS